MGARVRFFGLSFLVAVGCSAPTEPTGDSGPLDAEADARGTDAAAACDDDADCDDDAYCTGVETCTASRCVSGPPPCMPSACDEVAARCNCAVPDGDDDGADAIACGGDDCDDTNPLVFPGAAEVCDVDDVDEDCEPETFGFRDGDLDGAVDAACCNDGGECGTDCDDDNATVHPGSTEACDGFDDDCDGSIDELVLRTFLPDADGDGFGVDAGPSVMACFPPADHSEMGGDCDDDPLTGGPVHPGAVDTCDLGLIDEDCNGMPNDPPGGCDCEVGVEPRPCLLGGLCASGVEVCTDIGVWGECSVRPAPEICNGIDEDCDDVLDNGTTVSCFADDDNDGYASSAAAMTTPCPDASRPDVGECPSGTTNRPPVVPSLDCAGMDPTRSPGSAEVCNGIDEDCDGTIDDGVTVTCYADVDGDAFATFASAPRALCPDVGRPSVGMCPVGYTNAPPVGSAIDCDDASSTVFPGASETCNGVDDDCDTMRDEGTTVGCNADVDGDTYAAAGAARQQLCPDASRPSVGECPFGFTNRMPVGIGTVDCDDLQGVISPAATEVCNMIDDDCDGPRDEGTTIACYVDSDADTYAAAGTMSTAVCRDPARPTVGECPIGYTNRAPMGVGQIDCNDLDGTRSPASLEICDMIDQDCDGTPDDGITVVCYVDADADTYAPASASAQARCPDDARPLVGRCPVGYTNRSPASSSDCNDADASVLPGGTELCNGRDDNCNGSTDEGVLTRYYRDQDNDLHGTSAVFVDRCAPGISGYVEDNTDCNDSSGSIHPGATEECNCVDEDCDSVADDGLMTVCVFRDADGDDHGDVASGACDALRCLPPTGPLCDPAYARDRLDCNDANPAVHPGAGEVCLNSVDDDCNGMVDDGAPRWYHDIDGDHYGNDADTVVACSDPDGAPGDLTGLWVNRGGDCDSTRVWVHPDAIEECDGLDTDCDTVALQLGEVPSSHGLNHPDEDDDDDGRGDVLCAPPAPVTRTALTDCNDGRADVYPGATEVVGDQVDQDCNGRETCFVDGDGDDHRTVAPTTVDSPNAACTEAGEGDVLQPADDCNDSVASVHGGALEIIADEVDEDCDGGEICYRNADGDSRRTTLTIVSPNATCSASGEAPATLAEGDCNDAVATINPDATETVGDEIDQTCDGQEICFENRDADAYRTTVTRVSADADCADALEARATVLTLDCNDLVFAINPAATEVVADGTDQNCDMGEICYQNGDGDGYRTTLTVVSVNASCGDPGEALGGLPSGDCDDGDAARYPGNAETVDNGVDNDCVGFELCYQDSDSDGHRHTNTALRVTSGDLDCLDATEGRTIEPADDCDDGNASRYPGNADNVTGGANTGNGVDNDCDGVELCYVDADDDGYRSRGATACTSTSECIAGRVCVSGLCHPTVTSSSDVDCLDGTEAASSLPGNDCADADMTRNPGNSDSNWRYVANEIDNDCDGGEVCFLDNDDDNFRPQGSGATCTQDPDSCGGASVCVGPLLRCRPTIVSANSTCGDAREASGSIPATDCCDANATVRPDQTASFPTMYTGTGCTPSFDYDCDGSAEPEFPMCTSSPLCGFGCPGAGTWLGCPVPACGASAPRYLSCPSSCATRTQGCH